MARKKILVMVDWFAPGYKAGGPIQSCVNFAFLMKNDFDIYVLTTDTDHGETRPYEGIVSNQWINNIDPAINVYYARKASLSLGQLKQQLLSIDADYVYLNHLFSPRFVLYPLWLKYSGRLKSKIVLCPRGALYESALSVKSFKKKPFIRLFKWLAMHKKITFHATNEREKRAIDAYFPGSEVIIADNLPKTGQPAFSTIIKERGILKSIFIARIVPIKNLLFLLEVLQNSASSIELDIVGPVEDASYWEECKKRIEMLPPNIKVHYQGSKRNDELTALIQQHHLFILPTAGENFGHSIFEALLAGRPVLISDQTPWLRLAEKKAGWDLPLHEPSKFLDTINMAAGFGQQEFDDWASGAWQYARSFIEKTELRQKYLELFP